MDGVTLSFTIIVILFEIAIDGKVQFALLVRIQLITSLFERELSEYEKRLLPALFPFFFH